MENPSNSDPNSQLPRGLITRRGQSQRLPSLRSDSHSSQSLIGANAATASVPVTTKGGVLKRTFKPTIPVRRTAEDNSKQKQTKDSSQSSRRGKQPKTWNNSRGKGGNDSKNWIQTEGAVFRGEHNPELRSNRAKDESVIRRSSNRNEMLMKSEVKSEGSDDKSSKMKIESKAKIIRKLYGDNFIDDEDQRGDQKHLIFPKGWHSVSNSRVPMPSGAEPLTPYNLLKTESQEKLLLMQIPEEFLKRSDGYVGKMRVYKSGRIELHDSDSNMKFDIIFDQNIDLAKNVKIENKSKLWNKRAESGGEDISEDVVYFSGTDLCALAAIDQKEVLLAVPQIPLDQQIRPNLLL